MTAPEIASPSWLLVKTCQDLVTKSQSPDFYAKLRMAGLVRHLLVGTHALLDRASDAGDEPVVFWFREPPADREWTTAEGFDASRRMIAHGEVRRTDRTDFLRARIAHFGQWYSVGELLAAVDHFYAGSPSQGLEAISRSSMAALDQAVRSRPNAVAVALQEVSGVTLRALRGFAEKHQPTGERPGVAATRAPIAPAGSGCPFAGKIALE